MGQEIEVFDWTRILFGDEPPLFRLEIVFRTVVLYLYTLGLLRWLGSRTIGQLSTIEFLLVIALGPAVGNAMFYPDVPLVHAFLVITLVIAGNKALDLIIGHSPKSEQAIDGVPEEAVRGGVICNSFLKSRTLSAGELFQQLREKGISHLGEVANAYIETNGVVTVYRAKAKQPGLPIAPPWEIKMPEAVEPSEIADPQPVACKTCGTVARATPELDHCSHCGDDEWVWAKI